MKKFSKVVESITLNSFSNTIITLSSEDWIGVYINGLLADQGHSVNFRNVIDYCILNEICFGEMKWVSINDRYEEEFWNKLGYNCPDNFSEIVKTCEELGLDIGYQIK